MELRLNHREGKRAPILALSGWRGVGKTTFCQKLVELARSREMDVAGILSPGCFTISQDPGTLPLKIGIEVEDIRTGERRLLATSLECEFHGPRLGRWIFNDQVFTWANGLLRTITHCDLLIIDELGPLEFDQQLGWAYAFELLSQQRYRFAIAVIRPEYLECFLDRYPGTDRLTLTGTIDIQSLTGQVISQVMAQSI